MANRPSAPAPEALPGNKQTQKLCFMDKLVRMLEECDPSVLRWSQTGESFLVADLKR